MRKFFCSIPKLFWAVLCYLVALMLALVSGFFTFKFYTDNSKGFDLYAMGLMAVSLEFIKLMFSAGYPFMRGKHKKNENTVLLVMKISLILSILASLYYLLVGKSISSSPASETVKMLYDYIPVLKIIPLSFSQFLATISLSVLIEFFIVFLPVIAPIMFYQKEREDQEKHKKSNISKLKEIITTIPENFVDRFYKKLVQRKKYEHKVNVEEPQLDSRPKLKVLKTTNLVKLDPDRDTSKLISNTEIENNTKDKDVSNFAPNMDFGGWKNTNQKDVLGVIYKYKNDNICPSVALIGQETYLKKNEIYDIKKEFEKQGIIKTDGKQTFILIDTYQEALKALKGGGVYYE